MEEEEEEEEVKGRASMRRRVSSSSELRYPKLNLSVTAIFLLSVPTAPRHHNSVGGSAKDLSQCKMAQRVGQGAEKGSTAHHTVEQGRQEMSRDMIRATELDVRYNDKK